MTIKSFKNRIFNKKRGVNESIMSILIMMKFNYLDLLINNPFSIFNS